ncbi:hypothetical protein C7C46_27580 [Streptomyces tateyamensis]|uniref:Uncharacterized protein n=1 Tax=Streptomyces tateyamensis TaxID=565073 RepID=A0A2V4NJS3_9ACTN|nr:hypothetical protein [Streptomyces tateyamensis]PYC70171.1 hypothetical protein C7C46_27580 [Streptomyces tateyamensis]
MPATAPTRPPSRTITRALLRLVAATALAVDAAFHARLAEQYDTVASTISEGDLFRAEAAAAALAAVLVLAWRRRVGDVFGLVVAAAGLAAILLYRYVDLGALGPLPDMYEPIWSPDKTVAALAQTIALAALLLLLVRRPRATPPEDG